MTRNDAWRRPSRPVEGAEEVEGRPEAKRVNGNAVMLLVFFIVVVVGLILGYAVPPLGIWLGRP